MLAHISRFWFDRTEDLIGNHLVAMAGDASGVAMPEGLSHEIARQSMVVKRAQRLDVECIVRGYLAGSAWAEYRRSGTVWGQKMPQGLVEGQELPEPMFTPTTKADVGHDENMTPDQVLDMFGADLARQLEEKSLAIYSSANEYARSKGIILVDTKMEFGLLDGRLILIDELLTPDSSRFWDASGYEPGRSLPQLRQAVRPGLAGLPGLGTTSRRPPSCPPKSWRGPRNGTWRPIDASRGRAFPGLNRARL